MALTQMQLIQSLGEAMAWLERELGWGVPATELRHLCGRIGELYAALISNGQMAVPVNNPGYDVVSKQGEKISVKTTATRNYSGHLTFNPNSLKNVDRIIVLRINTDEMQIELLLDKPVAEARRLMTRKHGGAYNLPLTRLAKKDRPRNEIKTANQAWYRFYTVRELETGTIEIEKDGQAIAPVMPILKELAGSLNVSLLNTNGNPLNTRQLGSLVIRAISELPSVIKPDYLPNTPVNP